jgi:nitronate monooxygenase
MAARKLDVPFIASGGIADGKQLAACLALGAEGVNMGTRFMVIPPYMRTCTPSKALYRLLALGEAPILHPIKYDGITLSVFITSILQATQEAPIHANIKNTLVQKDQSDTMLILKSLKNTERVFKNDQAKIAAAEEAKNPGDVAVIVRHISGSKYKESFQVSGNPNDSVWSAGVVMGLIEDVPTVKGLIDGMVAEAGAVIENRLVGLMASKSGL